MRLAGEETDVQMEERYLPGAWLEQAEITRHLRQLENAPVSCFCISACVSSMRTSFS
jgi:hypothetical protein